MLDGYSQITRTLYLGGKFESVADVAALKALGVAYVLNCRDVPDPDYVMSAFVYWQAEPAQPDNGLARGIEWFKSGLLFLRSAGVTYVHCHAGLNRSASMVYARLLDFGLSDFEARFIIDRHRPMDLFGIRYAGEAEQFIGALDG